ncbi:hypothetical protein ACJW31_01G226400 [Castanea mollissima]
MKSRRRVSDKVNDKWTWQTPRNEPPNAFLTFVTVRCNRPNLKHLKKKKRRPQVSNLVASGKGGVVPVDEEDEQSYNADDPFMSLSLGSGEGSDQSCDTAELGRSSNRFGSFTNAERIPEISKSLKDLEESQKGQTVQGLREVKHYLNKYGYLNYEDSNNFEEDEFDEAMEVAIKAYQTFFHLKVTGKLDIDTIKQMSIPRCGVPDIMNGSVAQPQFSFIPGKPIWPFNKHNLTYAFVSSTGPNVNVHQMKAAGSYAFREWAKISNFTFELTGDVGNADLILGFHRGDHGDGLPFDGPGGHLAHALPPTNGRLHYDADENWTVGNTVSRNQIDLRGVSLHEIGHLLGLGHSQNESSIMYPSIKEGQKIWTRQKKRNLSSDDVDGLKSLYSSS